MQHIADWTQESTPNETLLFIKELALAHASQGGTQGANIGRLLSSGDYPSLCDISLDYEVGSVDELMHCRQALAFFTKLKCLPLKGVDTRQNAIDKLYQSERECRDTNHLFQLRRQGSFSFEPWVEQVIKSAQSKIRRILGPVPGVSELNYRFGPGATTLTKKRDASVTEKLQAPLSCSEDLIPIVGRLLEEMPGYSSLHACAEDEETMLVNIVITNDVIDFVPKNAKTDRSIAKGGTLNLMCQLALGDYMTDRLQSFGIDLRDQSVNQTHALEGSLYGNKATLDLSSASDTISTEVVYELLPIDWAVTLDLCRSKVVRLGTDEIELEKFSSMGNGYTFPLESLIFWALTSAASSDGFASVYGDDIICSTESVGPVIRILQIFGFTLNQEKSFTSGPFRESCGADYIRGFDIRPYYQKELINPAELFRLHNFYVRRGLLDYARLVRDRINPCLRIYGPDGYGDGHLLGDWKPKDHKRRETHGYGGVIFDTYKLIGKKDFRPLRAGDRVLPSYSIYRNNGRESFLDPDVHTRTTASFLRMKKFQGQYTPEPIAERQSPVDGSFYKTPSYPGTCGYKRISIYTFDRPH